MCCIILNSSSLCDDSNANIFIIQKHLFSFNSIFSFNFCIRSEPLCSEVCSTGCFKKCTFDDCDLLDYLKEDMNTCCIGQKIKCRAIWPSSPPAKKKINTCITVNWPGITLTTNCGVRRRTSWFRIKLDNILMFE